MTVARIETDARMSQAVIHNGTVYLAGQVGTAGATVAQQTEDVLAQIDALLAQANTSKQNLLTATLWLADMADFPEVNRVWDAWIADGGKPARATSQCQLASPNYRIEIIVSAAID
jgi:enamine deaminase RidA (YjgF/YER057c/UK114 family)